MSRPVAIRAADPGRAAPGGEAAPRRTATVTGIAVAIVAAQVAAWLAIHHEAVIDAELLQPTYLGVAFDTGTGMSQYTAKALWGDRPRRVGMMTGVDRLAGFRIDVPPGRQLCVGRLAVGVYRAPPAQ